MQAIVQTEYGSAAVLRLAEVDRPGVGADQVLAQVRSAAVHAGDWHFLSQFAGYKLKVLTANPHQSDLTMLSNWLQTGQIKPYIDRVYALPEVPAAIDDVEQGKANGKVVISL